ncbi:MAG TPA: RDD family protein [Actinomycetota bacterium]|nr:RDD family protein [Actinomycetota bacterium]
MVGVAIPLGTGPVELGNYASFGRRFVALFIDGLVTGIVGAFVFPFGIGIGFVYHWLLVALNRGQTLGKMAMGIRVTTPDGGALDLGKSAARAGMALVSGFVIGLGYLWAAWDREKRTWHDMVAETRVYRVPQ